MNEVMLLIVCYSSKPEQDSIAVTPGSGGKEYSMC